MNQATREFRYSQTIRTLVIALLSFLFCSTPNAEITSINCDQSIVGLFKVFNFKYWKSNGENNYQVLIRNVSGHDIQELDADISIEDVNGSHMGGVDLDQMVPWAADETKKFTGALSSYQTSENLVIYLCVMKKKLAD